MVTGEGEGEEGRVRGEWGRGEFDSSTSHTRFSDKYRAEGRKKWWVFGKVFFPLVL